MVGEGYGVEGRIEVVFGVCLSGGDVEGMAVEGSDCIYLADCVVYLLKLGIEGDVVDSE